MLTPRQLLRCNETKSTATPMTSSPLPTLSMQSARSYGPAANAAQRTPSRTAAPAAVPISIPAGAYEEELEIAARTARSERGA